MLDDAFIADWCDRHLGDRPARVLFRSGHLSQVVAAELADGRRVVIKARRSGPRIAGCTEVQRYLARAGFPCPEPLAGPVLAGPVLAGPVLAGPVLAGGLAVTAEALVPGGSQLPATGGAAPFAALLARLIRSAPSPAAVPSLAPSPPWAAWDHPGPRVWPDRDDRGGDLNSAPGPAWVDDAARSVRERLRACAAPARVGHGDWESQNIRWTAERPLAVHDWDSAIAQPETAVVGLAAAVWPAAGAPGEAASVAQTEDFIAGYQRSAGRPWTKQEVQDAWAAGLWVRLFNVKKDAADGGGLQLDRLAGEVGERLARAGMRGCFAGRAGTA